MPKPQANYLHAKMMPIDRAGITELVVQRIKELLEQGELKAGSRLPPERELAELLNISRPSLRTALAGWAKDHKTENSSAKAKSK